MNKPQQQSIPSDEPASRQSPRKETSALERDRIEEFRAGDSEALNELLMPLLPRVRARLSRDLAGYPGCDLDEVFSDFQSSLLQAVPMFNASYPFEPYAWGVLSNVIKRAIRRAVTAKEFPESQFENADDEGEQTSILDRASRSEAADRPTPQMELLLERFLRIGGYPHQQVVFGFSILLQGKAKQTDARGEARVGVWGDPARVVGECGPAELGPLFDELMLGLEAHSHYDHGLLDRYRRPVDARLRMTGRELFARDVASFEVFSRLADAITATNRLEQYFGKRGGSASVADWCDKVKTRIHNSVLDPDSTRRNPIPFARPGEEPEV